MRVDFIAVATLATTLLPLVVSQQHALFVKRDALENGRRVTRQTSADQMVQNILQWLQGVYTQNSRRIRQGTFREYLPPTNTQKPRPFQPPNKDDDDDNFIGYPPSGFSPQPPFPGDGDTPRPYPTQKPRPFPTQKPRPFPTNPPPTGYPKPFPTNPPPTGYPDFTGYPTKPEPSHPPPTFPTHPTQTFPSHPPPTFPTHPPITDYPTEPTHPTHPPQTYPPATHPPTYPPATHPPTYPPATHPPTYPPATHPPTNPPTHPPTNPPTHPPTNPPTHPPTQTPPTHPPTQPPTHPPPTHPPPTHPPPTQPPPTHPPPTHPPPTHPPPTHPPPTHPPPTRPPPTHPPPTHPPPTHPPPTHPPPTHPQATEPVHPDTPYTSEPIHPPGQIVQTDPPLAHHTDPPIHHETEPPIHHETEPPTHETEPPTHETESPLPPGDNEQTGTDDEEDLKHPPHIHAIEVECAKDMMTINIEFNRPFDGIIYSKGYYHNPECRYVHEHSAQTKFSFTVSLNSCGTEFINAFDTQGQSYLENVLVLQNEAGIQEVWDTIRAVRCLWEGNLNKALSVALSVGMLTQEIVTFSGDTAMAKLDIQLGRGPFAPPANGLVKIGETMTLVVSVSGDPGFDIQVRDCRAKDSSGENVVALTDDNGCVIKPKLFGAFQKTRDTGNTGASIISFAYFNAFKFPDVMDLMIECNVELCKTDCEICADPHQKHEPGRRKRRDTYAYNDTLGEPITMGKLLRVILPEDLSDGEAIINLRQREEVCMSMHGFVIASGLLISLLSISTLLSAYLWLKSQRLVLQKY